MAVLDQSRSIWMETTSPTPFPRLDGDRTCDVAIVGAGITGLTAALLLARAGKQVVVVDSGQVAYGVSGHTTAHLTTMVDARYQDLIKDFGPKQAKMVAESSRAAIERIAAFVAEETIACDFERVTGLSRRSGPPAPAVACLHAPGLHRQLEWRRKIVGLSLSRRALQRDWRGDRRAAIAGPGRAVRIKKELRQRYLAKL